MSVGLTYRFDFMVIIYISVGKGSFLGLPVAFAFSIDVLQLGNRVLGSPDGVSFPVWVYCVNSYYPMGTERKSYFHA